MNKNIQKNLVKFIPFNLRKYFFKLKLFYKAPRLIFLSRQSFKTSSSPILLLSFPRSGSSWIGSIVGAGEDIRYLREPATTNYTLAKSKRISVFDQNSCENWAKYQTYINDSLLAKPNFTNAVIAYPEQWCSPKQLKKLLIKEVNPLIIEDYLNKKIKLVYLVRHPFSVAKSYQALNWRANDLFTKKFSQHTLSKISLFAPNIEKENIWRQMGYLQGWVEALVKNSIASTKRPTLITRYEDICQSPEEKFKKVFSFSNIDYSHATREKLKNSLLRKSNVAPGDFSLTRKSIELAQVKIKPDDYDNYLQLMKFYQQAFIDFKRSKEIEENTIKKISASYEINSPLVIICTARSL